MPNTKIKTKMQRIDPLFSEVATKYSKKMEEKYGIPIPKTLASRHMAETFEKLLEFNGPPIIKINEKKKHYPKFRTIQLFWAFDIPNKKK